MQLSPKDAWKRILDEARRQLPEQAIGTWLLPAEPLSLSNLNEAPRLGRSLALPTKNQGADAAPLASCLTFLTKHPACPPNI